MKIIDRYILVRFSTNFFIAFVVLMFIFFFHTIWLFIQELAGKNIGFMNIVKFLIYYTPSLTYLILPLSVIISSIMTFGSLAEKYEFVAIKASGISLARAMRSLIFFMILLSVGAFYIANNLIPIAEYKNYKFQYNISRAKPSLAITEGAFSDLGNFNIRVDKKYGPDDRFLKNVVIHKTNKNSHNKVVIRSKSGELISADVNDFVKLILKEGYYYEDVEEKSSKKTYTHAKSHFDTYIINIDLSNLNQDKFDESKRVNSFRMMTSEKLSTAIDSLKTEYSTDTKAFSKDIYNRTHISTIDAGIFSKKDKDILENNNYEIPIDTILNQLDTTRLVQVFDNSIRNMEMLLRLAESKHLEMKLSKRKINRYIISYHDKFSLAFACLILFFTGAPLGAIIRKGGLGLPMVMAIVLFLCYYFIGLLTKNIAQNDEINPILSSWLADIVILPIGISLTIRVASDRRLFSFTKLYLLFDKLKSTYGSIFTKNKKTS